MRIQQEISTLLNNNSASMYVKSLCFVGILMQQSLSLLIFNSDEIINAYWKVHFLSQLMHLLMQQVFSSLFQ